MKERAVLRSEFEEEFKEKLVELVVYKNVSAEQVAKSITCQT
jgi:transposase-like protein